MANYRRRIARDEILDGAAHILDSGVFQDLTVDSLARHLHMSKSTLYKHFSSKDDLIVALVDSLCRSTERELEDTNFMDDPSDALDRIFKLYGAHAQRIPKALLLQRYKLPVVSQERMDLTAEIVGRACKGVVRRGIEAGKFGAVDTDILATCFLACARAAMEGSAKGEIALERDAAVAAVLELLMPALGANPVA
jgi:AcrR family transcriptional regulator